MERVMMDGQLYTVPVKMIIWRRSISCWKRGQGWMERVMMDRQLYTWPVFTVIWRWSISCWKRVQWLMEIRMMEILYGATLSQSKWSFGDGPSLVGNGCSGGWKE
jgi:hypothetical protein